MKRNPLAVARWAMLFALLVSATGCLAAAAGAGAAAGIYLTDQGASGIVNGNVGSVATRTDAVLRDLGVTVTEREGDNDEMEWKGTQGDMEINVEVKPEGNGTSRITASARKNTVQWDKEYARRIVERVVAAR